MSIGLSRDDSKVKIEHLLSEFYDSANQFRDLGICESASSIQEPYNALLNHNAHMTVTVESHHGGKVDVVVHRHHRTQDDRGDWYVREITLQTKKDQKVVQYGIVRLNVSALDPEVWKKIESREIPLGRVLIEHNVLREVQLCELWKFTAGEMLAKYLKTSIGETVFGRTALIYCDGEPAIELLEVVIA